MVEMTETSNQKLITKIAVSILALFLLVSWFPALGLPLGDSHEGRVLGQFALHMKNFWNLGVVDSSFGASWEPFSEIPYTHHPPALTFLHVVVSTVVGEGLRQIKLISYVAGILTVPAFFYMGKSLGINAKAVVVSVLLLITTPWWWVYGRLGLGFLPNVLMIGTIWSAMLNFSKRRIVFASLATLFAVSASWHGVFLMPFLCFQVWRRRKFDKLTLSLLGAGFIGGLVIFLWVSQGGGLAELGDHIGERVESNWTWGQFAERQWDFANTLLPLWYIVLALPAFLFGVFDFRTRFLTISLTLMVLVFAVVPSNGAWIHDYWNFPILLALFPGFAVISEWVICFIKEKSRSVFKNNTKVMPLTAFLLLFSVLAVILNPKDLHNEYFDKRSDAGRLVSEIEPASTQRFAWHLPQVPWPTWVSYDWNLPTRVISNVEELGTVPSDDIILLRIDRIPYWLDKEVKSMLEKGKGDYGTVEASVMKEYVIGIEK